MSVPSEGKLPLRLKLVHGLGSIAYGVKDNGFSTFLLLFYNQVLGMDAKLVSLALMLALVLDAFVDPVIGYLSDQTHTRWGRRLPWLYLAPIPLAFAWFALWTPDADAAPGFWHLVIVAMIVRSLVSCCEVPSVALLPELTRDYDERTTLMRYRFLFGWLGGLAATALAYGYFLKSDDPTKNGLLDPSGYVAFGLFGAALILVSTLGSAAGQHRRILALPPPPMRAHGPSMLAEIALALRNPAFLALASGSLFVITAYATSIAATNYVMLYVWRLTDAQLAWYPAGLVIAVFGAFAAVGGAHRRFGKRDTAAAAMLFSGTVAFLPYAARNLGWWPELGGWPSMILLLAFLTISLFGLVVANISCSSMVAEIVEAHEVEHGTRIEGVFFAGYLMTQKFGQALGIFIVGQLVALVGLGGRVRPEDWPAGTAAAMAWIFATLLILISIMAAVGLRRYPIDRASHEARLAALAGRTDAPPP